MAAEYVATEDLFVARGVRAHRAGDRVPAGNVKRNGWESKVEPLAAAPAPPAPASQKK